MTATRRDVIIDIHAHLGRCGMGILALADLQRYLGACGITRVVISNIEAAAVGGGDADEVVANSQCLEWARTERRAAALYWARPGEFDSHLAAVAGALETEPFAGAVFAPLLNGYDIRDTALLDPYLAILARLKAPAFIFTGREEPAAPAHIYALARRHPSVPIVLYDACRGTQWSEALDVTRRAAEREDARLLIDTAYAGAREIIDTIAAVGADHVLYGSGAPGDELLIKRLAERLDTLREELSADSLTKLCMENALALYRDIPARAAPAAD